MAAEAGCDSRTESDRAAWAFIQAVWARGVEEAEKRLAEILVEDVTQLMDEHGYLDTGRAFQHWVAVHVLGLVDEDVSEELSGNQSRDGGIDYFHADKESEVVDILQANFSENLDAIVQIDDLNAFFEVPDRLKNGTASNHVFREYQEQYKEATTPELKTRLIFVVAGDVAESLSYEISRKSRELAEQTTFELIQRKDLLGLIGKRKSPSCSLDVVRGEIFDAVDGESEKTVASVPASELARIYKEIGSSTLFNLNPRRYLGPNTISRKIRETIQSTPDKLWHYNNGISAICKSFEHDKQRSKLAIDDLKIVNGCQTVTAIGKYRGTIEPTATIMLRLSKVRGDDEFRNSISANTNRQNKIRATDMSSDRKELIILEKLFENYEHFFWERKRGDFKNLNGVRQAKYTKQRRKKLYVFDNVTAARLKLAFVLERPDLSIQMAEDDIFKEDGATKHGDGKSIQPFSAIYKGADPKDFIVPNIFLYLLRQIETGTDEERALLNLAIGRYYVIAMVGKALRTTQGDRKELEDRIIESAGKYDEDMIRLIQRLGMFVRSIVPALRTVLDPKSSPSEKKKIYEYRPQELRDKLKCNVLNDWYELRKDILDTNQIKEPLIKDLEELFELSV